MSPASTLPQIDGEQLLVDLERLAAFGRRAGGGIDRPAYSEADQAARAWVASRLSELGLDVRRDAAGNTIARLAGADPELPAIAIGSHTDTVPNGGMFDGALGVTAGIAVARALREAGVRLRHPLEVINFASEEAVVATTLGSRAMAGRFDAAELDQPAWDGRPVRMHLSEAGLDPARVLEARRQPGELCCYFELHPEQGRELERIGADIGVVTGIVAVRRYLVSFRGRAGHAGTTAMIDRHDALVAAAPLVGEVRKTAMDYGIVGTVGSLQVKPGVANVIPEWVELTLELRSLDQTKLDQAEAALRAFAEAAGGEWRVASVEPPAATDPRLQAIIVNVCERLGLTYHPLPSGAAHDAMHVGALAPQAMIFVPSRDGISHAPDEYTDPQHCVNGARVLLAAVLAADQAF